VSDAELHLPEVIASGRVHTGWLGLRIDRLRYPNGKETTSEVIEHGGGVVLVAFDGEGRLLMVRQYRHPTGRLLLELPAGTIDGGEDPEVCASRELQEETGFLPRRIEKLGGFYTAPGFCSEYLHIYLCGDLVESSLEGDEVQIALQPVPLDDVLAMISAGEIEDAKTAGALLLYLQRRESKNA
jgi:ADP-ribose pyrophosphatase